MGNSKSRDIILGGNKVRGLQLPGQSGKTRKMEEILTDLMNQARGQNTEDDFNIMFTSNSKLLVEQTSGRINNDLGPGSDIDSVNSSDSNNDLILMHGAGEWTSSQNMDHHAMYGNIIDDNTDMIVCCSNASRFKKVYKLIERLQKSNKFNKRINIWVDEAHKTIKLLQQYIQVLSLSKVKSVMLVSASWDPIDKIYKIPRLTYEITHPEVYRTLRECNWKIVEPLIPDNESVDNAITIDSSTTAPGYITQILQNLELSNLIQKPGSCWLIPGNTKTITHDAIAEDLLERGWNGLKLNGKEKALIIHIGKITLDYTEYNKTKLEPKDVLMNLFKQFPQLKNAPFFITGLNCIKEGITFQGDGFMFDGAIIPHMNDASDAYQLACRIAGNVKGLTLYETHKKPLIITTSRMQKKIIRQENIAIFLPRILYQDGRNIPTEFDKNQAARGHVSHDPKGYGYRVFSQFSSYIAYIRKLGRTTHFKYEPNGENEHIGKHTCSVQSSRGAKSQPRYLTEVIDKIDLAYGGKGAEKTGFPCYLDVNKAPDGLVWLVVIPEKLEKKEKIEEADDLYPNEYNELKKKAVEYR